jgi:hypothetical protein
MGGKKDKDCWIIPFRRMWESFLHVFILPSVTNQIKTNLIVTDDVSKIEDCMYQAMLLFFTKVNPEAKKESLIFVMPPRIKKAVMEDLYGSEIFKDKSTIKSLSSFKGIEMFATKSISHSIVLVDKEDGQIYIYYEHSHKRVVMDIEPVDEKKWIRIVLPN